MERSTMKAYIHNLIELMDFVFDSAKNKSILATKARKILWFISISCMKSL